MSLDSERRAAAAAKYKPDRVRFLLVAEAPPADLARYFYFEDIRSHDYLRYVCCGLSGGIPQRKHKPQHLGRLRERGVFLIDVSLAPILAGTTPSARLLEPFVPDLIERCRKLEPEHIVLIKATVYDAVFERMKAEGLPVVDVRMPFPSTGRQMDFLRGFLRALEMIGWPRLDDPR